MDKVALIHERDRLDYLISRATRFQFGELKVEDRGHGLWAVLHNGCCYDSMEGAFVWEPMPSGRTDEFLAATRFTRAKAIELAEALSASK